MKWFRRRFPLYFTVLFLCMGLSQPFVRLLNGRGDAPAQPSVSAADTQPVSAAPARDGFRVWDVGKSVLYTRTEAEFLRGSVLCEMSFEAPKEALKAQAVAAATFYTRRKAENAGKDYDLTCDSEARLVYMTDETAASYFGARWDEAKAAADAACAEVLGKRVLWNGEPAETRCCAVSAGCTRAYGEIPGGEDLPYLCGVACPFDQLWDGYLAESAFSPEEVRAAFPEISFSDDPASWFSQPELSQSRYVRTVSLCGEPLSGDAVRAALGLRSPAFSVAFDGERFLFTTKGWGQGVGMSQAGAIYLAELGADYRDILAYFFPGTTVE